MLEARIKPVNLSAHYFESDPKLFRLYTSFTDYQIFKVIVESFSSTVNNFIYIGSNTNLRDVFLLTAQKSSKEMSTCTIGGISCPF